MLSPEALYPGVHGVVQALGVARSEAGASSVAVGSLASLITAVLLGQSLRRAELGRAQASERSVPARQRYLRVARGLTRPWLSSAELTPHLIRAALAVVDDPAPPNSARGLRSRAPPFAPTIRPLRACRRNWPRMSA